MKKIIRLLSSFILIKWISLFFIKLSWFLSRIISHFKFKALITNSGDSVCHHTVEIKYGSNITIGNNCAIGKYSCLGAKSTIQIGNNVTISRGVIIETAGLDLSNDNKSRHSSKPIIIEDNVWIATNAIILGGVTIHKNAIIAAGAVITKDIPEGSIIVGARNRDLRKK